MVSQTCPNDDQLLAFAEGLLVDPERAQMEAHLAECPVCSAIIGATYQRPGELSVIGRYEIREELGRGGMGRVLEAWDPSLNRLVAIKVILSTALSSTSRERFTREAETLAALQHPNVIPVYDVGEIDDAPYFVMERIDGVTLDVWARQRRIAEIIACLRDAGEGLAAVHRAGVLHRDFKPANVIVGADGRPRVGDFGLAGVDLVDTAPLDGPTDASLTKTGAVMGTLPYMAPELLDGGKATPASDQFAFCVSMFEVVYGRLPFLGTTPRALSSAIRTGPLPTPRTEHVVPRRIRRVLERGLAADANDRFGSMRDLLRALRPNRRLPLVGLGAAAAATAAFVLATPAHADCSAPARALEATYDATARAEIQAAFTASDHPHAADSARSTLAGLDAYARTWVDGATATCRASNDGTIADAALDLQTHCHRRTLQGFAAAVASLRNPTEHHIRRGPEFVAGLRTAHVCADTAALERLLVLPTDAAQTAEEDTLSPVLAEANARVLVDDFDGAWVQLEQHADAFERATYPPIAIRVLELRARVLLHRQDLDGAKALSLRAQQQAVEHRLDHQASSTATFLGKIAAEQGDVRDAQRWFDLALARAEAAGSSRLEAQALATAAKLHEQRGDLERAVDTARRAYASIEHDETYPPTSRAEVLLVYAGQLLTAGTEDDGREQLETARQILLDVYGDAHPVIAEIEEDLQIRASRRGDYEASLQHGAEALRITIANEGPNALRVVAGRVNYAIALLELGRFEDAARFLRQADAVLAEHFPKAQSTRIAILSNLANVMLALDDVDQARAAVREAKAISANRPDQATRAALLDGVHGLVELHAGNLDTARQLASASLDASTAIFGQHHFRTADAATRLAHVELELGHHAAAKTLLGQALAVDDMTDADRGEATFLLARATYEPPKANLADKQHALELASKAEQALASKPASAKRRGEVQAWLSARRTID
ncbi:MAG: protein kinase [Myxococcota bacterium]